MMTAEDLYALIEDWKSNTFLKKYTLTFDHNIYIEALNTFIYDYRRWFTDDEHIDIDKLILTPQLHGILTYRIASLWHKSGISSEVKQQDILSNIGRIHSLSEIYYSAAIGTGLKINHGIGTTIGARAKIGNNCLLHQNVTLGDKNSGRPTIGDNCVIYAGATIIGDINIGNNCIIGANSVVLNSFPDNSIIAGVPARKIK